MGAFVNVRPAQCAHIADFYEREWQTRPCLAWQLLRRGYRQWADGRIERGTNNLFGSKRKATP